MVDDKYDWLGHQPEDLIPKLRSLLADLEAVAGNGRLLEPEVTAVMEDWTVWRRPVPRLVGRVLGHPEIRTGRPAITSELFLIDQHRKLARSLSRWYQLSNGKQDLTGWHPSTQ